MNEESQRNRALIAAIIKQAIDDVRTNIGHPSIGKGENAEAVINDAFDFIFSDRINWFAESVDMDVDAIREALLRSQFKRCTMHEIPLTKDRDIENRKRFNFRENYERYRATTGSQVH